jgi:hypothetical protein
MRTLCQKLRNILHGVGTVLDIAPAPLPPLRLPKPRQTPWEALCADGAKVGGDLYAALRKPATEAPGATRGTTRLPT